MPPVSHNGHLTNTHVSYAPGAVIATATNFTVAGMPVARVGDPLTPHPHTGSAPPHTGATISQGASSFSVGSKAVARVYDPTSCSGKLAQGVSNFTVGG